MNNKVFKTNKELDEITKYKNIIEITGLIIDIFDYFLISSQSLAPELLYTYYGKHKILIKIIYFFGGLILIGIFFIMILIKENITNNGQFNEVELR